MFRTRMADEGGQISLTHLISYPVTARTGGYLSTPGIWGSALNRLNRHNYHTFARRIETVSARGLWIRSAFLPYLVPCKSWRAATAALEQPSYSFLVWFWRLQCDVPKQRQRMKRGRGGALTASRF